MTVDCGERFEQQLDVVLQPDPLAGFVEVFFAHTAVKLGIVQQQISQLRALLDQIQAGHTERFAFEFSRRDAQHFTEHIAGVVKAQRLIKITGKDITFKCSLCHTTLDSHTKMKGQ